MNNKDLPEAVTDSSENLLKDIKEMKLSDNKQDKVATSFVNFYEDILNSGKFKVSASIMQHHIKLYDDTSIFQTR